MTLMSLKSGTLNFCKGCSECFFVKVVQNVSSLEWKGCFFGSLEFLFGPSLMILILSDNLFYHPIFIDQYLD